jgi:hypothetical protein
MTKDFDAAKLIQSIESLGAELPVTVMQDGKPHVFPKYRWLANKAQVDVLWKEVERCPERLDAVIKALLERDQNR